LVGEGIGGGIAIRPCAYNGAGVKACGKRPVLNESSSCLTSSGQSWQIKQLFFIRTSRQKGAMFYPSALTDCHHLRAALSALKENTSLF
jgi:hypothetical protein